MLRIWKPALEEVCRHAEETSPEECCGCLSSEAPGAVVTEVSRGTNIQNQLHRENPQEHPRTAKEAYTIDPLELAHTEEALDDRGRSLAGVYHSHPEEEPHFSAEDQRRALVGEEPMWEGAHYLIVSVKDGKVAGAKSFAWDPSVSDFVEEPIEVIE